VTVVYDNFGIGAVHGTAESPLALRSAPGTPVAVEGGVTVRNLDNVRVQPDFVSLAGVDYGARAAGWVFSLLIVPAARGMISSAHRAVRERTPNMAVRRAL
jgi:hypothetical protein